MPQSATSSAPAIADIVYWNRNLRNKKCEEVKLFDERLEKLCDRLRAACLHYNGAGLAAPQIGEFVRVAFINAPLGNQYIMINPVIDEINSKGEQVDFESCLSIPTAAKVCARVRRCHEIVFSYQNLSAERIEKKVTGFEARAVQHEVDHLSGIFYIDRIGDLTRDMVMRSYGKWLQWYAERSGRS